MALLIQQLQQEALAGRQDAEQCGLDDERKRAEETKNEARAC